MASLRSYSNVSCGPGKRAIHVFLPQQRVSAKSLHRVVFAKDYAMNGGKDVSLPPHASNMAHNLTPQHAHYPPMPNQVISGGPMRQPLPQSHTNPPRPYPPTPVARPPPFMHARAPSAVPHGAAQGGLHMGGPPHPQAPPPVAPSVPAQQPSHPVHVVQMQPVGGDVIIDKLKLDELAREVEPNVVLEDAVKDVLLEYTEEFVDELVDRVCRLVTHRGNNRLEVRDVQLVLDTVFHMPQVPRAATHIFAPNQSSHQNSKNPAEAAHNNRIALIRKTLKKV